MMGLLDERNKLTQQVADLMKDEDKQEIFRVLCGWMPIENMRLMVKFLKIDKGQE